MFTTRELAAADWHKSSRSGANGNCVEVADNLNDVVLVRDTKDRGTGLVLRVSPGAWSAFLASCKAGDYNQG
jgi:hypothetical protein